MSPTAHAPVLCVVVGGWVFFHALDMVLITPGETVTLSIGARLLVVGAGFCLTILGIGSLIESRPIDDQHYQPRISRPSSGTTPASPPPSPPDHGSDFSPRSQASTPPGSA